jgi:hypothetical protein
MKDYSKYQKKIINNYYNNFDTIKLNQLQEIVTEIYLSDSPAKSQRLWSKAESSMKALKVPESIRQNILVKKDVQILAKNLNEWLKK